MGKKFLSLVLLFAIIIPAIFPAESSGSEDGRYVTFTKYLPGGETETVKMFLPYSKDFSRAIAEKCAEMAREDKAIRQFLNDSGLKLYFIMSAGDGFHFAFPPSILKLSLWSISLSLFPSAIYCNYRGENAETDIIPIMPSGDSTTIYGSHRILTLGFIGVVGWDGLFSVSSSGFAGFTFFVWTSS
ncbi:MAG: hypothetical protein DRN33_01935 [Thermoplasmata archaeon]|nr:MAG: hypothetical protein FE043_03425 [Thermoplasmata archaeon]RLF64558.1 MAG: hypothetical protein DRN33_01935 [Thermoplasmata archaeon]